MSYQITMTEMDGLLERMSGEIFQAYDGREMLKDPIRVYGVPRGGVPVALGLSGVMPIELVNNPVHAEIIVDDLVDSGTTRERWEAAYPDKPFFALINKSEEPKYEGKWLVFPWEATDSQSIEDNIIRLIQYIGDDPARGGLEETPTRVAKAWKDWCEGYSVDPASVLKVFEDGGENYDQMIIRKDIPVYSHCEHHMAPIVGRCTIAYIPDGKIVGLSKLDRLVNVFARRLQVQERLTSQIADALEECLKPVGVGVWISARHMCIESRGVRHRDSDTVTTALRGALREQGDARSEFLNAV